MTKVLVVDDEFLIRSSLGQFLASEGYEVMTAENGLKGLEMAGAEHFDFVITDLSMPGLDGWELLDSLMKFSSPPRVIVITGQDTEGNRRRVQEKGGWGYVDKSSLVHHIGDALKTGFNNGNKRPVG